MALTGMEKLTERLLGCRAVCVVSLPLGLVGANVALLGVCYSSNPPVMMLMNALAAAYAVFFYFLIVLVFSAAGRSQVAKPVVPLDTILVVNLPARPRTSNVSPRQSVGEAALAANLDVNVSSRVDGTGPHMGEPGIPCRPIQWIFLPEKESGLSFVAKHLPDVRDIKIVVLKSNKWFSLLSHSILHRSFRSGAAASVISAPLPRPLYREASSCSTTI